MRRGGRTEHAIAGMHSDNNRCDRYRGARHSSCLGSQSTQASLGVRIKKPLLSLFFARGGAICVARRDGFDSACVTGHPVVSGAQTENTLDAPEPMLGVPRRLDNKPVCLLAPACRAPRPTCFGGRVVDLTPGHTFRKRSGTTPRASNHSAMNGSGRTRPQLPEPIPELDLIADLAQSGQVLVEHVVCVVKPRPTLCRSQSEPAPDPVGERSKPAEPCRRTQP